MHPEHVVPRKLPGEVNRKSASDVAQQVHVLDRLMGLELRRKPGVQGFERVHRQGRQEGAVRPLLQFVESQNLSRLPMANQGSFGIVT